MSYFYQQKFTSPEPVWAEVKEMLKSYFDSGAIDSLLFPRWTETCMKKIGKSSLQIKTTCIELDDFTACLPDDFESVRELWATAVVATNNVTDGTGYYYQKDCRVSQVYDRCACADTDQCTHILPSTTDCNNDCSPCTDAKYRVIHKQTNQWRYEFMLSHLLVPGNIRSRESCGSHCPNIGASGDDSFDIHNGKVVTNFSHGLLYLQYYSQLEDEEGDMMIPDNYFVEDYLRKFLLFKCFESLSNSISDETFNQVERKRALYKDEQGKAFILCKNELKKPTIYQTIRSIRRVKNRYRGGYWDIK